MSNCGKVEKECQDSYLLRHSLHTANNPPNYITTTVKVVRLDKDQPARNYFQTTKTDLQVDRYYINFFIVYASKF
jgi:hypothetical protein